MVNKYKIKIFHDGPTIDEIIKPINNLISGYTFNPTLFKKIGIKNYLEGCKKILKLTFPLNTSLEVIADNERDMIKQALIISSLGPNVSVKIPIVFTNGTSTKKVISYLINKKIKLNITAIFSYEQIVEILPIISKSNCILSIFIGRIYDCGLNADVIANKISNLVKKKTNCILLWASPRLSYDIIKAEQFTFDIITLNSDLIKKIKLFGTSLKKASQNTVKTFYLDAKSSRYKI
jgi:transaldolase